MKHENLNVKGMTCAACVASVERATSKLEGIHNVSVNLATEKLTFDYNTEILTIDAIKKSCQRCRL